MVNGSCVRWDRHRSEIELLEGTEVREYEKMKLTDRLLDSCKKYV